MTNIPIKFISTVPGLENDKKFTPKLAKNYMPEWWKEIPSTSKGIPTVKLCPSFPDYWSQSFIIPMWMDFSLTKEDDGSIKGFRSDGKMMGAHAPEQFLNHLDLKINNSSAEMVLKFECPWRIVTPKGYSVMQMPLFYHFNEDFTVLPGIIDTDIHHQVNQQTLFHPKNKIAEIKAGDPFVMYFPYKREKYKTEISLVSEKQNKIFSLQEKEFIENTKDHISGVYRKWQRKSRDV